MTRSRLMYIECKAGDIEGPGRIGRVTFSNSGRRMRYRGQEFASLRGAGFKANYRCLETGEEYWISAPKKRGGDRLYGGVVEVDPDAAEEYWTEIRGQPERRHELVVKDSGKYTR